MRMCICARITNQVCIQTCDVSNAQMAGGTSIRGARDIPEAITGCFRHEDQVSEWRRECPIQPHAHAHAHERPIQPHMSSFTFGFLESCGTKVSAAHAHVCTHTHVSACTCMHTHMYLHAPARSWFILYSNCVTQCTCPLLYSNCVTQCTCPLLYSNCVTQCTCPLLYSNCVTQADFGCLRV
jgi:hypothetical protein